MNSIEQRVANGVEWLDVNRAGWIGDIDLAALNLASPCRCVLGQLYGNFFEAPVMPNSAALYGFDASIYDEIEAYKDLHDEWVRVITARREAK